MSFWYSFFELLKKHHADRRSRGVVGNRGIKIPTTPNIKETKPNISSTIFILSRQPICPKPNL